MPARKDEQVVVPINEFSSVDEETQSEITQVTGRPAAAGIRRILKVFRMLEECVKCGGRILVIKKNEDGDDNG